jgi:hypothetical protein
MADTMSNQLTGQDSDNSPDMSGTRRKVDIINGQTDTSLWDVCLSGCLSVRPKRLHDRVIPEEREPQMTTPVEMIKLGCSAGLSFAQIDERVMKAFPPLTVKDLIAAYREAARQQEAEARELEEWGRRRSASGGQWPSRNKRIISAGR